MLATSFNMESSENLNRETQNSLSLLDNAPELGSWVHYPKEIATKVQYFFITDTSLFVNCKCKKETAKSAICNSSSSIITGNVIRFDNNFLFFGNFFVKLKDQNTSKFLANHLRRGGRFCEISSKVAKYKRIPDFRENFLIHDFITTIFFY